MDINTLAAWGEFLGGIAVVVSLVYLASQIRQNSRLLEAAGADAMMQVTSQSSLLITQDGEVSRIFWDGIEDRDGLSEADRRRFDPLISMQFLGYSQHHGYSLRGLADTRAWKTQQMGLRWQLAQPGVRQWWREWRGTFAEEFQHFVDGLIREGEAAG